MLLSAENICKNYGGKQILSGVTLHMPEKRKLGLIGVNGTGKTTLLNILAGIAEPDAGKVTRHPSARVSFLSQTPKMDEGLTALEWVLSGFDARFREENAHEAKEMLTRLGITDYDCPVGELSGGQQKRVALAEAFTRPAELLILDEPTNHIDSDMVVWLEEKLISMPTAMIIVTHDRYFLDRVVTHIAELDHGRLYEYEANYTRFLQLKAEREESAKASERKRQALLKKEYAWILRGCRARTTKSTERIARFETLKSEEAPPEQERVEMAAAFSRLGRKTIEMQNVCFAYGDTPVIDDFSLTLLRDDRIGVVGKNGAGKSTLLHLIAGALAPDSGSVDRGLTVKIGYFRQGAEDMDASLRVYDYVRQIASEVKTGDGVRTASQMLEQFLFPPDRQYDVIGKLSGGERRRLYLLGILMAAPNILLLDEPTNDIDVETLTVLEDYLSAFPGAVVAVSHDRYFLNKVASVILEVLPGGEVKRYEGNYQDYLEKRGLSAVKARQEETPAGAGTREKRKRDKKFTFQEQREYAAIDGEIAALEAKLADCERDIAQNASDYVALQTLTDAKAALERELNGKIERWVYLNDLAEEIEKAAEK